MELKPLLITRISSALIWPVLAGVLVVALYGDVHLGVVIGVGLVSLAVAAYIGLFGWRLGVVADDDGIEVHGLFRNRRIARDAVTSITDFPAVRWKSSDGKSHWTPIFAFTNIHRVMPLVDRHNEAAIALLQHWHTEPQEPAKADRRQQRRRRQRPAQ
ncbi:PH domain-containing protein [Kribbella sp. NPDC051718]|uniref:PH domain-containing protein n=1 Tax=Kribbella sp. NPDC051718 TaxID=3155168 RepID=UPI003426C878